MPNFRNSPQVQNENGQQTVKRYVHQPLTFEHYGIHGKIQENGKVLICSAPTPIPGTKDEVEYDEVEVPASLIFKLATLLKATRTIKFVSITEAKDLEPAEGV